MKTDKAKLLKEITSSIERFVHQDEDRKILRSILAHTVSLFEENEMLEHRNEELLLENVRLSVYEKFYEDGLNCKKGLTDQQVCTTNQVGYLR